MAAASRDRIQEESVRKAANALLKWKKKLRSQSDHEKFAQEDHEEPEGDDFVYLSITLKKVPPKDLTRTPHRIALRHSLHPQDHSALNVCLIVDGKRLTAEFANRTLKSQGIDAVKLALKVSKLKSDYKSFDSKKKLYDSFDLFLAAKRVVPLLPMVLGKVFYNKRKKIPVPVELGLDGGDWKEEIERACRSSLWCLSGGTCSAVRVGRMGVTKSEQIVENVFGAIDEVLEIVPGKWKWIKCIHLRFSDSVALPVYERPQATHSGGDEGNENIPLLAGKKRKREGRNGKKEIAK